MVSALKSAIKKINERRIHPKLSPWEMHKDVKEMYSWYNVAERTERIYYDIIDLPEPPLIERLSRYYGCGLIAGKLFCMVVAINFLMSVIFEWIWPRRSIEVVPDFPHKVYDQASYFKCAYSISPLITESVFCFVRY